MLNTTSTQHVHSLQCPAAAGGPAHDSLSQDKKRWGDQTRATRTLPRRHRGWGHSLGVGTAWRGKKQPGEGGGGGGRGQSRPPSRRCSRSSGARWRRHLAGPGSSDGAATRITPSHTRRVFLFRLLPTSLIIVVNKLEHQVLTG